MSVSLQVVNFDEIFSQLRQPPIIINDIAESTEDEKEGLRSLIFTDYDSDLLKNLPSCECGEIKGEFNIGVHCLNCNTKVSSPLDQELEPILWMRSPQEVQKLINPVIWLMLCQRFTKSGYNVIRWLTDTTYKTSVKPVDVLPELIEVGIQRGYNYFVENFFEIIEYMFNMKKFKGKDINNELLDLIMANKDCIFSDYIPLPNRSLLVVERTGVGVYVDNVITGAIDAIQTIASIDCSLTKHSVRAKENRTAKTIAGLADFYEQYITNQLGTKHGMFRQHIFGSRAHFSFRAVVTSITDKHEYDEVHIPWPVGISLFRYHLINKLMKLDYSVNAAIALLNTYAKVYNPLIDKIFDELIAESPRKGIDVTLNRNPSLARGSIQLCRITKIKKDPSIPTVSFSILIVTPLNADFDGKHIAFVKLF